MSRIQHILEKAERDGGVLRMRSMAEASALAFEQPEAIAPNPFDEPLIVEPAAPVLTPGRTVHGTPLDPLLVASLEPGASAAEQYRALRTRLTHSDHATPINVILVTSPGRREGKSLTAANLSLTMAQDFQRRICVVDADLRHSRLHSFFGLSEAPGLADVLAGRASLAEALVHLEDQQITVLPAGQPSAHPAELLGSAIMRQTIETLRSQFDRVIIDAPPTGPLADLGILAPLVDSVVLVVRAGVTTKPAIQEAVASLGPAPLLGVILNDATA
jgi:protein-tyrosine kinase